LVVRQAREERGQVGVSGVALERHRVATREVLEVAFVAFHLHGFGS
jgi:hypothetical protein